MTRSKKQQRVHPRVEYLSAKRVHLFVKGLSAAVTISLTLSAIISLYSVTSSWVKILLISIFTTGFGMWAVFLTDAQHLAVFAASAGYAAILVAFVSGNLDQK